MITGHNIPLDSEYRGIPNIKGLPDEFRGGHLGEDAEDIVLSTPAISYESDGTALGTIAARIHLDPTSPLVVDRALARAQDGGRLGCIKRIAGVGLIKSIDVQPVLTPVDSVDFATGENPISEAAKALSEAYDNDSAFEWVRGYSGHSRKSYLIFYAEASTGFSTATGRIVYSPWTDHLKFYRKAVDLRASKDKDEFFQYCRDGDFTSL